MTGVDIKHLVILLATKPRLGMRAALDLQIRGGVLVLLAALVVVITGIVGYFTSAFGPGSEEVVAPSPMGYVVVAASNIVLTSFVFFWAGRTIKGTGDFQDVALALILHQGFMVLLPIWVMLFAIFIPSLFQVAMLLGFGYLLYLMAGFIAEAHGLRSIGAAFFLILVVLVVLSVTLLFFLALFGIAPA